MKLLRSITKRLARRLDCELVPRGPRALPADFTEREREIVRAVQPYTMTSPERIQALIAAVGYLTRNEIDGDFVECGVWRGGSMMAAAMALMDSGQQRELHLFDTYQGMPKPGERDSAGGISALEKFEATRTGEDSSDWCRAGIDEVRAALESTGYPPARMHFIAGKVEQTVPAQAPERIAMLRLDTDWYASTRHELEHLYPRLVEGGVLIVDDYGHWRGARQAVDEYFQTHPEPLMLVRVDGTGRVALRTRR